jgi:hypothetical protein
MANTWFRTPTIRKVHHVLISRSLMALAAAAAVLTPTAAPAADAAGSGWWTASPLAVAPDAQDALVVQGGPRADQPVSYAAVQFTLAEGESAARLTLTTAPSSASTPTATLTVCPLTGALAPADGGPMADAPRYDCASSASSPATDGAYSFDLSGLSASGTLGLAVLPGAPSDRVVLAKPGADALETSGADTSTGGEVAFGTDSSTADGFGSPAPTGSFVAPATDPVPASSVGAPAAGPVDAAPAPVDADAHVASSSDGGRPVAPLVFVLLVLVAAALWTTAGRRTREAAAV